MEDIDERTDTPELICPLIPSSNTAPQRRHTSPIQEINRNGFLTRTDISIPCLSPKPQKKLRRNSETPTPSRLFDLHVPLKYGTRFTLVTTPHGSRYFAPGSSIPLDWYVPFGPAAGHRFGKGTKSPVNAKFTSCVIQANCVLLTGVYFSQRVRLVLVRVCGTRE